MSETRSRPHPTSAFLSSGCFYNHLVNLSTSAACDETSDDAIVVLKATTLATFTILAGHSDRNGWSTVAQWRPYRINPVDGCIVLRLAARTSYDNYAIVRIRPLDEASPLSTKGYAVLRGRELAVFRAVGGRITYVGALGFEELGDEPYLSIEPDGGPDDVRLVAQYMARTYPKVRARMVVDQMRMMVRADGPAD